MTQKQYDDMQTIMQFGRLFVDAMRKAMDHSGLLQQGYYLEVVVDNNNDHEDLNVSGHVRLEKYGNDCTEDMSQIEIDGERWMIIDDPFAKTGLVPPEVRIRAKNDGQGAGKDSAKPYPPDGLWLSSRDNYPDVVGGM